MNPLRSSLAPMAHLSREPDPAAARRAAEQAWLNSGLVLLNPEWLTEWDRAQLVILADKYLGKRKGR